MLNVNLGPFAVQVSHVLLLVSLLLAAVVGHLVGRPQRIGIGHVLLDMLLVALLAARVVFVALWFDGYRQAPWSVVDIRDGGFTPWAGVVAGLLLAFWRGWRSPPLRKPLALGLIAGALAWDMSGAPGMVSHTPLPTVPLTAAGGAPASLAALAQGQPVVVNLWATWCPPCRSEMPLLAAAQQQETRVRFVFVNQGEDEGTAQRYLAAAGLSLANVWTDPASGLGRAVGSSALPTTLLYDASGRLVDFHVGALSAASLESLLSQLR
jgi:thiol-disulfide isomerase/thioredoxin